MRIRTEAFILCHCCGDNGPEGNVGGTHLSCADDEMVIRCCLEEVVNVCQIAKRNLVR